MKNLTEVLNEQTELVLTENSDLIIAFHIGRGGRFNNQGHLSYVGEHKITESMFIEHLFTNTEETQYTDSNGKEVGLPVDNDGTGTIDIDGDYDTSYAIRVSEIGDNELQAIIKTDGYNGSFAKKLRTAYNTIEE